MTEVNEDEKRMAEAMLNSDSRQQVQETMQALQDQRNYTRNQPMWPVGQSARPQPVPTKPLPQIKAEKEKKGFLGFLSKKKTLWAIIGVSAAILLLAVLLLYLVFA